MKVTVKQGVAENFIGFFDHARRRPGDVFTIPDQPRRLPFPKEQRDIELGGEAAEVFNQIKDKQGKIPQAFSFAWMEPVAINVPEKVSTAQQALDQRSAIIKDEKAAQRSLDGGGAGGTGGADVI